MPSSWCASRATPRWRSRRCVTWCGLTAFRCITSATGCTAMPTSSSTAWCCARWTPETRARSRRSSNRIPRCSTSASPRRVTEELAAAFAAAALANVTREFPRHVSHLSSSPREQLDQRKLHPAFYGSYDWHSAVHMHWTLVRVLRLYPSLPVATVIAERLDAHLAAPAISRELRYFESAAGRTFERPYGWAWLLELQAELLRLGNARWADAVQPLASELARRMATFVNGAPYPIRAGTHGNTAFAGLLALDYAREAKDAALEDEIRMAARRWYRADRNAPLTYEPSLDEFLSPALIEA